MKIRYLVLIAIIKLSATPLTGITLALSLLANNELIELRSYIVFEFDERDK